MDVHFIGQIVGGRGFGGVEGGGSGLFCKFEVEHDPGAGWVLIEGTPVGQTHVDVPVDSDMSTWDHPLDLHFRTQSVAHWPKIKLTVFHHDEFATNQLCGYGFVHLPCSPGYHTITCPTWRPKGTWFEELTSYFVGGAVQLTNDNVVTSPLDRSQLHTVSTGGVTLSIAVILKNHELHGILS